MCHEWPARFAFTCWVIWCCRNKKFWRELSRQFSSNSPPFIIFLKIGNVLRFLIKILSRLEFLVWLLGPLLLQEALRSMLMGNPGPAGAEGLIRDDCARWTVGFPASAGFGANMMAELLAMKYGLSWPRTGTFRSVILESYCAQAVDFIIGSTISYHPLSALVFDIKSNNELSLNQLHILKIIIILFYFIVNFLKNNFLKYF